MLMISFVFACLMTSFVASVAQQQEAAIRHEVHSPFHAHASLTKGQGFLHLDMKPVSADFDHNNIVVAPMGSTTTTTQFLNVDVKTQDCGTVVRRISYRLNFCVLANGELGTFVGSFKFYSSLSGGFYRLGQYVYESHDCTGTFQTQTVSNFGVPTTCGSLQLSSFATGINPYYYSFQVDDNLDDSMYNYLATVTTGTDLGNPTDSGILFRYFSPFYLLHKYADHFFLLQIIQPVDHSLHKQRCQSIVPQCLANNCSQWWFPLLYQLRQAHMFWS
jgi:hypothetical protein